MVRLRYREPDTSWFQYCQDAKNAKAKERIYLTRSGKRIAAIVPIEDVEAIEKIEDCIDRRALKRAEMAVKGTVPLENVKADLGIE